MLGASAHGRKLFGRITPAKALGVLRHILNELCVPRLDEFRTLDLRRGHAQDLVDSGKVAYAFCMRDVVVALYVQVLHLR